MLPALGDMLKLVLTWNKGFYYGFQSHKSAKGWANTLEIEINPCKNKEATPGVWEIFRKFVHNVGISFDKKPLI